MYINDRIKYRRKELGLSVEQICSQLNISRASYYRYESTEVNNMPITAIAPLAKILNVSPAWIMGWEYTTPIVGVEKDLLDDFRGLSPEGQRDLLKYMRMLKADENDQA